MICTSVSETTVGQAVPLSQMEEVTGSMLDAAKSGDSNKLQVSRDVVLAALAQPLHGCMRGISRARARVA